MARRALTGALVLLAVVACTGARAAETPPKTEAPAVAPESAVQPQLAATPGPQPALAIESTRIDLGDVNEGDDAVAVFQFRNTGDAELKILSARPG